MGWIRKLITDMAQEVRFVDVLAWLVFVFMLILFLHLQGAIQI